MCTLRSTCGIQLNVHLTKLSGIVIGSESKDEWLAVRDPALFSYWSIFSFSIKHLKILQPEGAEHEAPSATLAESLELSNAIWVKIILVKN